MKKIQTKSDKLAFGNTRFLTLNDHIKFESLTFQVNPWDVSKVFDSSLTSIKCSDTLEFMTTMEVDSCLNDWYKALKIGGEFSLLVPNTNYFAKIWLDAEWTEADLRNPDSPGRISRSGLYGKQSKGNPKIDNYDPSYFDIIKTPFNENYLEFLLLRVGFDSIDIKKPNPQTLLARAVKTMDKGERQVAPEIEQIRKDHRKRYYFAAEHVKDGDKILDFACGIGYGSKIILNKTENVKITACDIDENALKYGNTFYSSKNICYQQNNANQPTLKENSYNLAVSFETIEHLENPKNFIEALYKSLKCNGKLICSVPNEEKMPYDRTRHPFHFRHYHEKELVKVLSDAGFQNIQVFSQKNSGNCDIVETRSGDFLILVALKI